MKYKQVIAVILFSCWLTSAYSQTSQKKYALLVGISRYLNVDPLKYSHQDAIQFKEFLKTGVAGNFDSIRLFTEDTACVEKVLPALTIWAKNLGSDLQRGDEVYIYFSGHGFPRAEGLDLALYNSYYSKDTSNHQLWGVLGYNEIKEAVDKLSSVNGVKVFLIIDACRKAQNIRDNVLSKNIITNAFSAHSIQFYSADQNQYSFEADSLGGGRSVFSYFLELGLSGAADENGDGVSLGELYDYLGKRVNDYVKNVLKVKDRQTPYYNNNLDTLVVSRPGTKQRLKAVDNDARIQKIIVNATAKAAPVRKSLSVTPLFAGYRRYSPKLLSDTSAGGVLGNFQRAMRRRLLALPEEASAVAFYKKMKAAGVEKRILSYCEEVLLGEIIQHTQGLLNDYLVGRNNAAIKVWDTAYAELYALKDILGEDASLVHTVSPKLIFFRAKSLIDTGIPDSLRLALRLIDTSLLQAPDAAYCYQTRSYINYKLGKFFTAIQDAKTAISLAPHWTYPVYRLAAIYYDLGEHAKSMMLCKKLMVMDSTYPYSYEVLALNYEHIRKYDSALYWNTQAMRFDATNSTPYYYAGRISVSLDDYTAALKYYREGAALGDADCLQGIGMIFDSRSEKDSAGYYYRAAVRADSLNGNAVGSLAIFNTNNDDRPGSDSLFLRYVHAWKTGSSYSDYAFVKFQSNKKSGDSLFEKAVEINNQDPWIYINYSRAWEVYGKNQDKAAAVLKAGISHMPDNPLLYQRIGFFYHTQNDDEKAGYYFQKALEMDPENSFSHFYMYEHFLHKENIDSAEKYLKTAVRLNSYIDAATLFPFDLSLLADKKVREQQYATGLRLYKMMVGSPDNWLLYKIAAVSYLICQQDSASLYLSLIKRPSDDRVLAMKCLELKALLAYDSGSFREALTLFAELDNKYRTRPKLIEQAICLSKMGETEKSYEVLRQAGEANISAFLADDNGETTPVYNSWFINDGKKIIGNAKIHHHL